jgi:DNA-binding SARP family transcriptional activator
MYEIRLLGPFALFRDGERMSDQQVGSRKARTLLKRLLVDRDRVVSVDALADILWPGQLPDQPDRHIATLVSRLRAALGSEAMVREGGGYRFGGGPAYLVDLDQVERLAGDAEARLAAGAAGPARDAAERALTLLDRGELLADEPYADWVAPARARAAGLLRRTRRSAWAAALAVRDLDLAARIAEEALAAEPFNEEACRALMSAHRDRGSPGLALAAYERLREALAEELGTDPSTETRDLHRAILRAEHEQPPAAPPAAATGWQPEPGLVGREAELARLQKAWSTASAGTATLALLVGEAGIGKTRLATEVVRLAEAAGGTVARARCYEAERSLFLQPVVDALQPLAGPSGLDFLPEYHRVSPELERRRVFEGVLGFVRARAGRAPLLIFLDDLHQAGSSTLEVLHFLLRQAAGARMLVLATVRVEEAGEVVDTLGVLAERCDLGPLPEQAVRELARRNGLAELTDKLMAQTRGHTLSVVETLRAIQERPDKQAGGSLPESLRAAVVARMRRAGAPVEELLRAAATLGGSFDPTLLASLTDEPVEETARRAHAASQARLLTEAGAGYEFANDLIREIAYQTTPLPTRIARHRRAAELFAGSPEAIARHSSAAGDWPVALEGYLRAAEAAARRYAHRDAERLLEQALAAAVRADDPVGVARARLARGQSREALTDYQGAYEDHSAVVKLARTQRRPDLELAALRWLGGDLLIGMRRPVRECIPYLDSALVLAEATGDVPSQVSILGRLAVIWTNRLRLDLARSYADRAVALAEPRHGEAVQAMALDAVKTTLAYGGEVAELAAMLPRLHACLAGDDAFPPLRAWAAFESAFPPLAEARWPQAASGIRRAVAICRESGYPAYEGPFLAHLAWVERARGRYGEALRHARAAAAIAEETGHPWWVALAETMLGWTLTEIGALDEAVVRLERGLAAADRDASEGYLVRCLTHLAWACAARGERDRAAALCDRAEALLSEVTGGPFRHLAHAGLAAATARLELGEHRAAERLLAPLREAAAEAGWVETMAWADLLRARCQLDPEPAMSALKLAERHRLPGIAWQAHALLADLRSAAAHRDAAAAIVDRLAGSLDDGELRASFRASALRCLGSG